VTVTDFEAPAAATAKFSERFGVKVERISNRTLALNGIQVKVNTVRASDEAAARTIEQAMLASRGPAFIARRGADVVEVAGTSIVVAQAVRAALGIPRATVATFDVHVRLGLLEEGDAGECNDVFNLFLALAKKPGDPALTAQVEKTARGWRLGDTLRLAASREGGWEVEYAFTPEPVERRVEGDRIVVRFADAPRAHGIPYVDVRATARVMAHYSPRFLPSGSKEEPDFVGPTARWPSEDPAIVAKARALVSGVSSPTQKVLAFLRYLSTEFAYEGPMGSRHGTKKAFDQGFGRCWDKSDVLVTLCRAAGIPAREIAGWVPPLEGGHIWTEVHLAGAGWIPVDATTPWLGTSEDYVPLFTTSDGEMQILHLAWPEIERRDP